MTARKSERPLPVAEVAKLLERRLPHSPEAEMALLGTIIFDPQVLIDVLDILDGAEDFFLIKHGVIYDTMVHLYEQSPQFDIVQLNDALRDRDLLEKVGDTDYLVELVESVPSAAGAVRYAETIRDKARLRRLADAAGKILHQVAMSNGDAQSVIDIAEQAIFEVTHNHLGLEPLG